MCSTNMALRMTPIQLYSNVCLDLLTSLQEDLFYFVAHSVNGKSNQSLAFAILKKPYVGPKVCIDLSLDELSYVEEH
jgi:hypothetical protein